MRAWVVFFLVGSMVLFGCTAEEYLGGQEEGPSMDAESQYLFPEISAPENGEAGISVPAETAATERCEDSDGGFQIHTKGTTRLIENGQEKVVKEDFCLDSNTLYEYYCENGALTHDSVKCPCSGGVCEPVLDYTECVDSDGGNEKYVKGTITLIKHYTDGAIVEEQPVEDHCITDTDLIEYLCREDGTFRKYTYTCLYCVDGVCTQ